MIALARIVLSIALLAGDAWARGEGLPPVAPAIAGPLVVLRHSGPWSAPYGSPSFVLYSDRLVIFAARDESPSPSGYLSTRLPEGAFKSLVSQIAPQALLKLAPFYDAVTSTDPGYIQLDVWVDGHRKTTSVAGYIEDPRSDAAARSRVPAEFLRACDAIGKFSPPARAWLPARIELLLRREHFHEPPPARRGMRRRGQERVRVQPWPIGWPLPDAAPASADGFRRVALPGRQFRWLKKMFPDGASRPATVNIEDVLWVVWYRLPFPAETAWQDEAPRHGPTRSLMR